MVQHVRREASSLTTNAGHLATAIGALLTVFWDGVWMFAQWSDDRREHPIGARSARPDEIWLSAVALDWQRICEAQDADGSAFSVEDWVFYRATREDGLWSYHGDQCGDLPAGEALPMGLLPSQWIERLTGVDPLQPRESSFVTLRLPGDAVIDVIDVSEAEIPFK